MSHGRRIRSSDDAMACSTDEDSPTLAISRTRPPFRCTKLARPSASLPRRREPHPHLHRLRRRGDGALGRFRSAARGNERRNGARRNEAPPPNRHARQRPAAQQVIQGIARDAPPTTPAPARSNTTRDPYTASSTLRYPTPSIGAATLRSTVASRVRRSMTSPKRNPPSAFQVKLWTNT